MELKVVVEGVQRVVCGISELTTCQDVIYALAYATGKTGRFILVEKWRSTERTLSPQDQPLKLLAKWGEYANDIQFVLRCLDHSNQEHYQSYGEGRNGNNLVANSGSNVRSSTKTVSKSADQQTKPYFIDTAAPEPESGTLRSGVKDGHQWQDQISMKVPSRQTVFPSDPGELTYVSSSNYLQQVAAKRGANLSVLSHSAHEKLSDTSIVPQSQRNDISYPAVHYAVPSLTNVPNGQRGFVAHSNNGRPPPPSYEHALTQRRTQLSSGTPLPPYLLRRSDSPSGSVALSNRSVATPSSMLSRWGSRENVLQILENQKIMLKEQDDKLKDLDKEIIASEQREQVTMREIEQMSAQIQLMEQKQRQTRQEIDALTGSRDLFSELQHLREETNRVRVELARTKRDVTAKEMEIDFQRSQAQKLQIDLEKVQAQAFKSDLNGNDLNAGGEMVHLREELQAVQLEGQNVRRAIDDVDHEISQVEAIIQTKKQRLEELAQKIRDVGAIIDSGSPSPGTSEGDPAPDDSKGNEPMRRVWV